MNTPLSLSLLKSHPVKWSMNSLLRKYGVNSMHINTRLKSTTSKWSEFNRSANPLEEILNTVPPESNALSPSDTLNIFRRLCDTSQNLPPNATSFNVTSHTNFAILRQAMRVSLPYFKWEEKIEVLKAIQILCVPVNDDVFNATCSSILEIVYNLSLNEIMILDIILTSQQQNEMTKQLRQRLIDRFNAKTSQLPVEFSYYIQIRRMLKFIARNRRHIHEEVFINIQKCAIKKRIDIFYASEAMDLIILLSEFGAQCEYFWPILNKSFSVWSSSIDVNIRMVEIVLKFLVKRNVDSALYKDARFIEKCAQVAIAHGSLEKCFSIQRQFNRLDFSSKNLIDFLFDHLTDKRIRDDFMLNCITVCIACDIAYYRPPRFDEILLPHLSSMNFHQQFDIRTNWPKFALRLYRLGLYHKPLIDEILKQRSDFQSSDADSIEMLEVLQLEKLLNTSIGRLLPDLRCMAGEKIRLLVAADNGATIPLLLKMDIHSARFVPFDGSECNSLSSIQCDGNQCLVALVTSSTSDVRHLQPNIVTIPLNSSEEWLKLFQHQSQDSFFADIHSRVQNHRNRLEITSIFQ